MRERRQRKKEESAALKIQAVHRGRKVKSLFLIPRTGNQYDVVFFLQQVRRDLDFRSVAQKKKAGAEVGDEMLEMKNRMIAMRAKMKERERKVDALKLKKIKRMESGVDGAQGSSYFGAEKKRLERKETMRTKRAMRR